MVLELVLAAVEVVVVAAAAVAGEEVDMDKVEEQKEIQKAVLVEDKMAKEMDQERVPAKLAAEVKVLVDPMVGEILHQMVVEKVGAGKVVEMVEKNHRMVEKQHRMEQMVAEHMDQLYFYELSWHFHDSHSRKFENLNRSPVDIKEICVKLILFRKRAKKLTPINKTT